MRSVTTIVFGSNRFIDCETLVALRNDPLLRVTAAPLRLTLVTPSTLPSKRMVVVVENEKRPESNSDVQVVASDTSVAVFLGEAPLAIATLIDPSTINIRADLRPLGINLFDDATGLHVGTMHFSGNSVSNAQTAFQLG